METTAKRAPVDAGSARRTAAKQRRTIAQKSCNHIARELEVAYDGAWARNCFRKGALLPLGMDLLHPLRLAKLRKDPRWRPPKGALEALGIFAMLIWRWHLPKTHARAGESGKSLLATNSIMASIGGCSPDQWARYARPFLEYFDLIVGAPTTRAGEYRGRDGKVIKAPEGHTLYMPGDALLELLGMRERRIEKSRRALIAVARRQLAGRDRKNSDPKALVLSFASQSSRTSRARGALPLAHASVRTYERPRRSVRPATKASKPRTAPAAALSRCSSPASVATSPATAGDPTPTNSQRLVTKGASAGAAAGGELQTQRQSAPVATEAAQAPPEASEPSPASDATAASVDAPVDEHAVVRGLLADFYAKTGGDRDQPSTTPPPIAGRQGSLPGRGLGALLPVTQRRARDLDKAPAPAAPPRSPPTSTPPASSPGSILGAPRSPAEREENERRRREALERARRETGDDDDDGGAA